MTGMSLSLPATWPVSLWFLIAALVVFVLQRIPLTGIFLMLVLAMFWSVLLVNAGMIGIAWEAVSGKVARGWLILPLAYFGGYYMLYAREQFAVRQVSSELAEFNQGKGLSYDPRRHDLVLEKGKGDLHPSVAQLLPDYAVPRAFEGPHVYFLGTPEACKLARSEFARTSGVGTHDLPGSRGKGLSLKPRGGGDICIIYAPASPDRPVLTIVSDRTSEHRGFLPLQTAQFTLRDETTGETSEIKSISAALLMPFPMPVIGCALNSGAPSWECSAGFIRGRNRALPAFGADQPAPDLLKLIASGLRLEPSGDRAARALDANVISRLTEAADRKLIEKELALLEAMLADPLGNHRDWFHHLPNRPEVVAPMAERIFAALGTLQQSDLRHSEVGRNLWRLAAVLPDAGLAPYRSSLVEWLDPARAKPWTETSNAIYARLDGAITAERAILLHRLETRKGDLQTSLLPSFCRMGDAAPDEVKQRLLGLWKARAPDPAKPKAERGQGDVRLYFTLARLGLKQQAGEVVQRYYGPTFAAIWSDVTPQSHQDLCDAEINDLTNYFRRQRTKGPT
ncbi:hypothetical protein [Novosphingobium sp.]|uniref:hypothetical protein n=1 Tax=Novosphingobium sp. TaxID=1874826 RepID=UPI001EC2755B|nr:hypothetical protein [Novosphingobium sp.]MBK9010748.1 hypothetical protein [Novosphingobium sp.]